jgi:hypothetical protein
MLLEIDEVDILSNMRSDAVFTCELILPAGETKIVAAAQIKAFTLPICVSGSLTPYKIFEAGAMRSAINGYGLQNILHAYRLINALVGVKVPPDLYIVATSGTNDHSRGNLVKGISFAAWKKPFAELVIVEEHSLRQIDKLSDGVKWFRPTFATLEQAAKTIAAVASCVQKCRVEKRAAGQADKWEDTDFNQSRYDQMSFQFEGDEKWKDRALSAIVELSRSIVRTPPKNIEEYYALTGRMLPVNCIWDGRD